MDLSTKMKYYISTQNRTICKYDNAIVSQCGKNKRDEGKYTAIDVDLIVKTNGRK